MTRFARRRANGWGGPAYRPLKAVTTEVSSEEELDALLSKFSAGAARVGSKPIDQLNWAVTFAQLAREEVTSELAKEDSLLIYEVARFVGDATLVLDKRKRSRVLQAHDLLEAMLTVYAERGRWSFTAKEVTFVLNGRGTATGDAELFYRTENRNTGMLLEAARLLEREGARLERCAASVCRRIFVVQRHAKKYCSTVCEQRENARRWRERHPGAAAAHQRASYKRKTDPRSKPDQTIAAAVARARGSVTEERK